MTEEKHMQCPARTHLAPVVRRVVTELISGETASGILLGKANILSISLVCGVLKSLSLPWSPNTPDSRMSTIINWRYSSLFIYSLLYFWIKRILLDALICFFLLYREKVSLSANLAL